MSINSTDKICNSTDIYVWIIKIFISYFIELTRALELHRLPLMKGLSLQRFCLMILCAATFPGCLERPKAGPGFESTGFTHTASITTCNQCHESVRPALPHVQTADCVNCHSYTSWVTTTPFVHTSSLTSCNSCHETDRPALPHVQATDCINCHNFTSWASVETMPHAASGATSGSTLDCVLCHGVSGTSTHKLATAASAHYFGATTCIGCHSNFSDFTQSLRYNHATKVQSGNCYECHNFNSGSYTSFTNLAQFNTTGSFTISTGLSVTGSFDGDSFTQPHSDPKMALCSSCHTYEAPAPGVNVWRFRHRPSNPGVPNYSEGQANTVPGCNSCHPT